MTQDYCISDTWGTYTICGKCGGYKTPPQYYGSTISPRMCSCPKEEDNNPFKNEINPTPAIYGWICPRCGVVHSPFVMYCDCPPPSILTNETT